METGARTPEELEMLLEDAFIARDGDALAALFEAGAVLGQAAGVAEARGGAAIGRWAAAVWDGGGSYVADPRRVLQARDLALVVAEWGVHVVRRGRDGAWRYAIALMSLDGTRPGGRG